MLKYVRITFAVLFSAMLLVSCMKKENRKELEESLKTTMVTYLNHRPGIDTSRVKFNILDVYFYEEKTAYLCQFKVNMKEKIGDQIKDTTGTMGAKISKDFKDLTRTK